MHLYLNNSTNLIIYNTSSRVSIPLLLCRALDSNFLVLRAVFYLQNEPVQLEYESVCQIRLPRSSISTKIPVDQSGAVDTVRVDMLRQVVPEL
jgi:hypothetical protein